MAADTNSLSPQDKGSLRLYGTVTYRRAAAFLTDVTEVEDWGCGAGGFKRFCRPRYVGVDGSKTPFADRVVDLCTYTSRVEGIMMRHVIEHSYLWRAILDNGQFVCKKVLSRPVHALRPRDARDRAQSSVRHRRTRSVLLPSRYREEFHGSALGSI